MAISARCVRKQPCSDDDDDNVYVAAWSVTDRDGSPGGAESPPLKSGRILRVTF